MYHKDTLRFKSVEQVQAIQAALAKKSDLFIILPTGGGKTLTYLLPIYMERELTTVIVLPYVVLVEQTEDQCRARGISYQVWRPTSYSIGNSQAVLVAVEHAVTPEFQTLLILLESSKQLGRLVVEECHTFITQQDFRVDMRKIYSLARCVSVPLQLLTATATPTMVERLRVDFGCHSLQVIRKVEDRKELKYLVQVVGNEVESLKDLDHMIVDFLGQAVGGWKGNDRGIVYCLRRDWSENLGKLINEELKEVGCGVYHAKMDLETRRQVLKDWKMGKTKLIAATSALGAGLDHGAVRLVLHQGFSQGLIDFCQETGRAGRDGKAADCVTFYWLGIEQQTRWMETKDKKEMLEWIKTNECRKKTLSIYLHGIGEDCISQSDGLMCDNCEKAMKGKEVSIVSPRIGRKRGREMERKEVEDAIIIKRMMEDLRGKCALCWMNGREERRLRHELFKCR
jgi:ATP-dependent DNA helicase RecQ